MVREILLLGHPVLRQRCEAVRNFRDPAVKEALADMEDTLTDFRRRRGFGRGIAAPQIGVGRRIIFVQIDRPIALLNARITGRSRQLMTLWDDCFSFPEIVVKVRRNVRISIEYRDPAGSRQTLTATGDLSELLQHEIDHTDGVLAIDRAVDSRHIILRSEWKKIVEPHRETAPL